MTSPLVPHVPSTLELSQTPCGGNCPTGFSPIFLGPNGRWFIAMFHPGFNTRANNARGYATQAQALATLRKFAGR